MREFVEIALFSDEVEAVRSFYGDLLDRPPESEWPGGAVFAVGRIKLLLHERTAGVANGPVNDDHVALGVPDVDAAADELRARGYTFQVEPREFPWGRSAYLRDPDGRLVELSQL